MKIMLSSGQVDINTSVYNLKIRISPNMLAYPDMERFKERSELSIHKEKYLYPDQSLINEDIDKINDFNKFLFIKKEEIKAFFSSTEGSAMLYEFKKNIEYLLSSDTVNALNILQPTSMLEEEVAQMLESAERGEPPRTPYHPQQWESVIEFINNTYGDYLTAFGAKEDCLYQDQLRKIHPDRMKLTLLEKRIRTESAKKLPNEAKLTQLKAQLSTLEKNYGSADWGYDVCKALQNYQQSKKSSATEYVKGKSDRMSRDRQQIEQSNIREQTHQDAYRLAYLLKTR